MTLQFTPKTAAERQAFLQQADAAMAESDREEKRLRREWLPTLTVARAMVPMRDGMAFAHLHLSAGSGGPLAGAVAARPLRLRGRVHRPGE